MRGIAKEAERYGALAVVGNGNVAQAQDFRRTHGRGLRSLVDSKREAYDALGYHNRLSLRRATLGTLAAAGPLSRGLVQGRVQGHANQLGGTLVVAAGGSPVFYHRADHAGDPSPPDVILAALKAAAAASKS